MSISVERREQNLDEYRTYVRLLGPIGVATARLDSRLRGLRRSRGFSDMSEHDVRDALRPALQDAQEAIQSKEPFDGGSWNDWYRLLGRACFATELVMAPKVFKSHDIERRAELANGTSGIATEIVERALHNYYDERATEDDRDELRGVINEYTPIALINRPQDGSSIALPGSLRADCRGKVDSVYYSTDGNGRNFRTNLQMKSLRRPLTEESRMAVERHLQVAYIYGNDFGNMGYRDSFDMSKILVSEYHGSGLTKTREAKIRKAQNTIKNRIFDQINKHNTLYPK